MFKIKIFYIVFSALIVAESLKEIKNDKNNYKTYIGFQYSILNYSKNGTKDTFQPTALAWNIGYVMRSFKYYSISLHSIFASGLNNVKKSISQLSNNDNITNLQISLDKLFSIGISHNFHINKKFSLYIYTGESIAKIISTSNEIDSKSKYDNSVSFGLGLNIHIKENVLINIEYINYFKNLNAVQTGLVFKI